MDHPLHQTLTEALDPFCTRTARDRIFAIAARGTGSATIPTDVFEFSEYVCGPLTAATIQVLGEDVAEQVKQSLAPILMTASSGCRPSGPPQPPTNRRLALVVQQPGRERAYVVTVLEELGFRTLTCADAMRANAIIAKSRPVLLCVESALPGISASQLAAMVRRAYGDDSPSFVVVPSDGEFEPADLLTAIDDTLNPRANAVAR